MSQATHRPLRLLLATARYFPFRGGIETHVYEVARRLVRAGVDVTVLTTDYTGKLPARERLDGVTIQRVRAWPAQEDYYFAPGIYPAIMRGSWDVIHCQGSHTFVPPLVLLAARRTKTPYVVTFHTGVHSSRVRMALRGAQWAALRTLFRGADRLVAVSRFEMDYFSRTLRVPRERFTLIPNGADLPAPADRAPLQVEGTLILSVGRLERYKGHQRAIAALPALREQCPDARLCVLGTGPYLGELQRLADELGVADRVDFRSVPAEDRPGMAAVLSRANLVVLLSDGESHPVAVMEALAMRRPVLVANTSGLSELADRGLVRALAVDSPPAAVASAMLRELRDPLVPPAIELPTWDQCADALLRVYQEVARRRACAS